MVHVGDEHQGPRLGAPGEADLRPGFHIGLGGLLALAQIVVGRRPVVRVHPEGHAAHRAAGRQAQHQARGLGNAAVMDRIDAEGAPPAEQPGRLALHVGKPRPPHQRAVSEHPAVFHAVRQRTIPFAPAPTIQGAPPNAKPGCASRRSQYGPALPLSGDPWTIRGHRCPPCGRA